MYHKTKNNSQNIIIKMRFTVSSTLLSSRLNALAKVFNSKNSMPILDCYLFEIIDGRLTVTASDNDNTIKTVIMLDECDQDGKFCITSRTILDAVKELAEQPITIDVDLNTMQTKIMYMNGLYNIVSTPHDEYPQVVPIQEGYKTITISSAQLSENISRSFFATAQDELRPVMNGIYFDMRPDGLSIVATDGHKLVRNTIFDIRSEEPASFNLPKKPANIIKSVLPKDDSEVIIRFDGRNAEFTYNGGTLTCRLTEGRYPNYSSVIPTNNNNHATIDRKMLLGAIKRVLPFASESSKLVRIHVENSKIEISAADIDFATSAKEESICEYNSIPMSIGFKGSTLIEVLNNLDSEDVILQLADPARAGLIVPAQQPEGQDILMLMMPMLLND